MLCQSCLPRSSWIDSPSTPSREAPPIIDPKTNIKSIRLTSFAWFVGPWMSCGDRPYG